MTLATITKSGKRFVLVPEADYRRLTDSSALRPAADKTELPPYPPVAADGTSNALEFARASIARSLIRDRRAAGLSQQELARLAGVRQETVSRIESGKHTATVRIIDKLDRALRGVARNGRTTNRRGH